MAGLGPRVAVACSVPAAALLLLISVYLLRRHRSRAADDDSESASPSEVREALLGPDPSPTCLRSEYGAQKQSPADHDTVVPSMALEVSTERQRAEDETPSPDALGDGDDSLPSGDSSVDSALCESSACSSVAASPRSVEKHSNCSDQRNENNIMGDMAALSLDVYKVDDGVEADATPPTEAETSATESHAEVVEEEGAALAVGGDGDGATVGNGECGEEGNVPCNGDNIGGTESKVPDDGGSDVALGLHSAFSDVHSEGSSDSGKGGSDIHVGSDSTATIPDDLPSVYEFELPQDLCGRLIGRGGRNVAAIKDHSNANIFVRRHPFNSKLKLCAVEGTQSEVKVAIDMIRKKFPLSTFPNVTLAQVNMLPYMEVTLPETLQLHLPEGVTCDVVLTSMVTAGHFFLQQPTHPTYPSLARLDQCMLTCYSQVDTPPLPRPVEAGIICAAEVMGGWFRALVVSVSEDGEECDVKFVDYGGYLHLSSSYLRQIRSDFMTLPFQASECYLGNVQPAEGSTWSVEACAMFEDLAQGQILQSLIVGYADNGLPYVHLYRIQGVSNVFINRELVNRGVARWTAMAH